MIIPAISLDITKNTSKKTFLNRLRIKYHVPPRIFLFVTQNKPGIPVYYS